MTLRNSHSQGHSTRRKKSIQALFQGRELPIAKGISG